MSENDGRRFEEKQQPDLDIEGEIWVNPLGDKSFQFDALKMK